VLWGNPNTGRATSAVSHGVVRKASWLRQHLSKDLKRVREEPRVPAQQRSREPQTWEGGCGGGQL
jgi:hypothetical protein